MRKIKQSVFFLMAALLFSNWIVAQTQDKIDSLVHSLNQEQGMKKVSAYFELANKMSYVDHERSEQYIHEGLAYLSTIDSISEFDRLSSMGSFSNVRSWGKFELFDYYTSFNESLKQDSLSKRMIELGEEEEGYKLAANGATIRGAIFHHQKQFKKSSFEFEHAMNCHIELNNTEGIAWGCQNIGYNLMKRDLHKEALPYFIKADSLMQTTGNRRDINVAQNSLGLGKCYLKLKDWQNAAKVYKNCIEISERIKYSRATLAKSSYSVALAKLGQLEKALKFGLEAKATLENESKTQDYVVSLRNLAIIEEARNNPKAALEYRKLAEAETTEQKDQQF